MQVYQWKKHLSKNNGLTANKQKWCLLLETIADITLVSIFPNVLAEILGIFFYLELIMSGCFQSHCSKTHLYGFFTDPILNASGIILLTERQFKFYRQKVTMFFFFQVSDCIFLTFFSIWIFFQKHSRFTGHQGKGLVISLIPLYHFHQLHSHLRSWNTFTYVTYFI